MGRPNKPQWHAIRQCWKATIGGKTRYFGKGIAPTERPQMAGVPERAWAAMNALLKETTPVLASPAPLTAAELCELYLAWAEKRRDEGRLSPAHYRSKEYHLGIFAEAWGDRTAEGLDAHTMEEFIATLRTRYSPNYVANLCASVSAAFNWAVRTKHLPSNPIAGYTVPTVPRSPERYAERKEIAALLRHWRTRTNRKSVVGRFDRLTLLLERVLIHTGARPGELCDLQWTDLRWDEGRTASGHAYAKATLPPERWKVGAKTGRTRTIYLTPTLTRALRREATRKDRHPTWVFTHGRGRGGKGAGEPWESGSRLSKKILKVRREAIAAGALPKDADQGHNRVTNYRFRHTAASSMLMLGLDVPTVAELLGTSAEMIHRIYGHLLDGHLAKAAETAARGHRSRPSGSTAKT